MKKGYYLKHLKIISLGLLFLLNFCSDESSIEEKKLAKIYVDMHLSQEFYSFNPDTLAIKQDSILKAYSVTREEFNRSIEAMPLNSEVWDSFFTYTQTYLDTLRKLNINPE